MNLLNILEGAAGGFLAAKSEDKIDEIAGKPDHIGCMHDDIHHIKELLKNISLYFKQQQEHTTIDTLLQIPVYPAFLPLPDKGRKHSYIFLGSSVLLTLNIPGVGTVPFAPLVGWTQLDLPNQTNIYVPSGGSIVPCLYRTSNQNMGGNAL